MSGQASEMKEHIIVCATNLFMDKGYGATTVNDVLKASNVAKGTFYHHFSSKEDLLYNVADRIKRKFMGILETVSAEEGLDTDERFAIIEKRISEVEESQWVHRELHDGDVAPTLLVNVLRKSFEEALPQYLTMVEDGRRDGSVNTPFPFTASILLLILNIISFHMEEDSLAEISHFRRAILQYTEDNIRKDGFK